VNNHKLGGLKQEKNTRVSEAKYLKGIDGGYTSSRNSMGKSTSCLLQLLVAASITWLEVAEQDEIKDFLCSSSVYHSTLPASLHCLLLFVIICLNN
jgi:hypothetical protein